MHTFKITFSDNWKYTEHGYFQAGSHKEAIAQVDKNTERILNDRFREIETTGRFYFVMKLKGCKGGISHIYECKPEISL